MLSGESSFKKPAAFSITCDQVFRDGNTGGNSLWEIPRNLKERDMYCSLIVLGMFGNIYTTSKNPWIYKFLELSLCISHCAEWFVGNSCWYPKGAVSSSISDPTWILLSDARFREDCSTPPWRSLCCGRSYQEGASNKEQPRQLVYFASTLSETFGFRIISSSGPSPLLSFPNSLLFWKSRAEAQRSVMTL